MRFWFADDCLRSRDYGLGMRVEGFRDEGLGFWVSGLGMKV